MTIEPWKSLTPIGYYESFKIMLATLTLVAPIRFLLLFLLLLIGWILAPFPCFKYVLRAGTRVVMFICGFYWVFQRGHPHEDARIFVSTHTSIWDALYLIYLVGACPAAKQDLFDMPMMGAYLRAFGSVPIDRHTSEGRARSVAAIAHRVRSKSLVVFPTGCCTNSRVLLPFKRGAFAAGVPIQPVGIAYLARYNDLKISPNMLWDLYRACCQGANWMAITFLPVVHQAEQETVRADMAHTLGIELVNNYQLETDQLRIKCRDAHIYFDHSMRICDFRFARKIFDKYKTLPLDSGGWAGPAVATPDEWPIILAAINKSTKSRETSACIKPRTTWTEKGWIGKLTGGRPRLVPTQASPDLVEDRIHLTQLISYLQSPDVHPLVYKVFSP